jgi:hypothetical protein
VRVRIYKAGAEEPRTTWPQVSTLGAIPGVEHARRAWQAFVAGERIGG